MLMLSFSMVLFIVEMLHNGSVPLFLLAIVDRLNIYNKLFARKMFVQLLLFKIVIVLFSTPAICVTLVVIYPEFDNARVVISRVPKTKRVSQDLNARVLVYTDPPCQKAYPLRSQPQISCHLQSQFVDTAP
eukprot:5188983-Heterocapsa_arctica.AAC.1